jgi:hypothetical protein
LHSSAILILWQFANSCTVTVPKVHKNLTN